MEMKALSEKLVSFIESYDNAFLIGIFGEKKLIYANRVAKSLYNVSDSGTDLEEVFAGYHKSLYDMVADGLKERNLVIYHNVPSHKSDGTILNVDLQIGFFNQEKTEVFIEIIHKQDTQEDVLRDIVLRGKKPLFLINEDEDFSLELANEAFFESFLCSEKSFAELYDNSFAKLLKSCNQERVLHNLLERLEKETECNVNFSFNTVTGKKKYFYMDMQRRQLLDGRQVLIGMLISIDYQVELSNKIKNINRQFDMIEKLTKETLYFVDVNTRTLIHRGEHAVQVGVPEVEQNFPACVYPRIHPEDLEGYQAHAYKMLSGEDSTYTVRMKVASGEYEWFQADSSVIFEDDKPVEIIGTIRNINEKKKMMEQSSSDMLTNTLNKAQMQEATSLILEHSNQCNYHALIFIDLDNLKDVNDKNGHEFVDYLLLQVGQRLEKKTRIGDLVGRVGEDEFMIFLRDVPSIDLVTMKAKLFLDAVLQEVTDGTVSNSVGASVGIATYPDHGISYEQVFFHADLALTESKKKGNNAITVYEDFMEGDNSN